MAEEKIRVLIVDDIAETRENIRKLLQFDAQIEVVGASRNGLEGVDLAIETQPDVVLMDINMPDMDGISATEAIRKKVPHTQIVILSVQGDSNYMRRAMLAGARDFLTKPIDVDELTAAIRRAGRVAWNEREKLASSGFGGQAGSGSGSGTLLPGDQGHVITVFSPKGGTGKTTLTANLAVSMRQQGQTVVAVDGNLQFGDLSFFFNEQGRNNVADLAPRTDELDREVVSEVLVRHESSGVHILAAPMRPEQADSVSGEQFGAVVNYLSRMYPYVLVDTGSTLNDLTLAALDAASMVVLLITQDIPSIKNARLFLDLAEGLGISKDQIVLVMNRFDKRRSITAERVRDNFKKEVAAVIPLEEKIVVPAMDRGEPFVLRNSSTPVAKAITDLASMLVAKLKAQVPSQLEVG
ncbi:MAG: response regulator [Anaerolineales bacterium]|nr:response regulator [Anaerolineales bacterium]QYK50547.1 MAG: response regulator [Anaerolineales bacterium]